MRFEKGPVAAAGEKCWRTNERTSCVLSFSVSATRSGTRERNAKHTVYTSTRRLKNSAHSLKRIPFAHANRREKREAAAAEMPTRVMHPLSLGRTISTFDAGWGANWGRMRMLSPYINITVGKWSEPILWLHQMTTFVIVANLNC